MAYQGRVKTWIAGETLYAADLNAEFDSVLASLIPEPAGIKHGDVLFRGVSSWQRLQYGTSGYFLSSKGADADPEWVDGMEDPLTTQGDVIYRGSSVTSRLAAGTKGQALTTGGAGANPSWTGITTQGDIEYHNGTTRTRLGAGAAKYSLVTGGAEANPSWAACAYAVLTTAGDILYYGASGLTRLAAGTENQLLKMGSDYPEWGAGTTDAIAGDYVEAKSDGIETVTGTTPTEKKKFIIGRDGTYTFKAYLNAGSGYYSYLRIYRNGSPVGTQQEGYSGNGTDVDFDISGWTAGDLCSAYLYCSYSYSNAYLRRLRICSGNPVTCAPHADDVDDDS